MAEEQIQTLKDQTDAIILITHLGDEDTAVSCTNEMLLGGLSENSLAEVTAVIDGHSYTLEETIYECNNISIPIIQSGCCFTNLSMITLEFDENKTVTTTGNVLNYTEAMAYSLTEEGEAASEAVTSALKEIKTSQETVLGEELCTNTTLL